MFDRGRFKIEKLDRGLHRFAYRCKKDQTQPFFARQWRDFDFSRENCGERSFAARENLIEIVRRTQESFDAVTGPAFYQARRPAVRHFGALCADEFVDLRPLGAQRFVHWADLLDPASVARALVATSGPKQNPCGRRKSLS